LSSQPLVSYIQDLQSIRKVGDYEIRGDAAVAANWGDDYVLNGERDIPGGRNGVGVPSDLFSDRAAAELDFGFQADRPGPLLSIQLLGKEPSDSTAPLAYIAESGTVMVAGGIYGSLGNGPNLLDGKWHELSLRRQDGAGWEVSVDGAAVGRLPEFLASSKARQVLQVGPALQRLGNRLDAWRSFYGKLRDVRVRTAAGASPAKESLSASE
jgi:hypothetical protein